MRVFVVLILCFNFMFGADSDGFRDIKWGDAPTKEMVISKYDATTNIKKYYLQNEKLSVGEASITGISYWFFDDKFMGAFMQFSGLSNFESLKSTLDAKFGNAHRPNKYLDDYMWMGGNTRVAIYYSKIKRSGMVMFVNDELAKQSDQYKKSIAAKAVNDI